MNTNTDGGGAQRPNLDAAFSLDSVWQASDEELRNYLRVLNTEGIPNDRVQHRAIIRGLTIHFIQLSRLVEAQRRSNTITQTWFMVLAIGSLIVGALALVF